LKIIFWGIFAGVIMLALYLYFLNIQQITNANTIIVIKSIIVLYLLISIPSALKLFSVKVKKIAQIENVTEKIMQYSKMSVVRLLLIESGLMLSVLGYFLLGQKDLIYAVAIALVALMFCIPTKKRIYGDLL
jgi:hypothetical protein